MGDRVSVALPFRDMVHAMFSYDLALLSAQIAADHSASGNAKENNFGVMLSAGTLIADQRCNLVAEALKEGVDWILWLDSDMRFPRDAYNRLRAHNLPIVGCNYSTRRLPVGPTAKKVIDEVWVEVPTKQDSTGLEEVNACGFGVMLTSTEVFRKMPEPWFLIGWSQVNHKPIGEDVYFSLAAAKAGYKTFIDHDLSKEIAHIGQMEFRHEHVDVMMDERREKILFEQAEERRMLDEAYARARLAKPEDVEAELAKIRTRYQPEPTAIFHKAAD